METFETFNPEIVILDVQSEIRWVLLVSKNETTVERSILFLSSRDNPMDQVMSMELGADDYMQNHFIQTS